MIRPTQIGLYGALGSRYRARSRRISEVELWMELVPFLSMPEVESVELLAEYVVFQEMPQYAHVQKLSEAINRVVESGLDADRTMTAAGAFVNNVPWCSLLRPTAAAVLRTAAINVQQT